MCKDCVGAASECRGKGKKIGEKATQQQKQAEGKTKEGERRGKIRCGKDKILSENNTNMWRSKKRKKQVGADREEPNERAESS